MAGGRWMVVTGGLVSRHRSKREARATVRRNGILRARLRRWRKDRVRWDAESALYFTKDPR